MNLEPRTMSSLDHCNAWLKHNDAAVKWLHQAETASSSDDVAGRAAIAQAHATLARTHAYLMVEGLR